MLFRLNQTLHEHRFITPILQELLHLLRELLERLTSDRMHAHSLSEENEIRIRHLGVRVSSVVEEI